MNTSYRRPSGKNRHQFFVGKADTLIYRWKSRHVDFSLEKPTRRFFVGKADTSIFRWKNRHVAFSLEKFAAARGAAGKSSLVTAAPANPLCHHRQSTHDFRYTTNIVVSIFIIAKNVLM